jgi:peptide/nickel transport system permease protein
VTRVLLYLASGGRHVANIALTMAGVLLLNFFLLHLIPGDAADVLAAESGGATGETMAVLRHHMGLDVPILQQLAVYLDNLAHLNLGFSLRYNAPVFDVIMSRLPATLILAGSSYALGIVLGALVGAIMATWRGRWPDRVLSGVVVVLYSAPSFLVGVLLIIFFSVQLRWLPSDGTSSIGLTLTGFPALADQAAHLVLPALALSAHFIAIYARLTRATMIEIEGQDFVRTARAKGVHPFFVTVRHIFRNALIPLSTMAGAHLAALLGGAATVEMVFSWPGIGRLALDAVQARDFTTLLGILLISSVVVVLSNLLVDAVQSLLDPRMRRRDAVA